MEVSSLGNDTFNLKSRYFLDRLTNDIKNNLARLNVNKKVCASLYIVSV